MDKIRNIYNKCKLYVTKWISDVKKGYAKLFKKCLVQETPKAKKNVKPKKTTKKS
jgi:hypothetical protein